MTGPQAVKIAEGYIKCRDLTREIAAHESTGAAMKQVRILRQELSAAQLSLDMAVDSAVEK